MAPLPVARITRCRPPLAAALAVTLVLASARPVAAQDERSTGAARALFQEGLRLVDEGQWELARDHFERALQLRRSPLIAFNLAISCAHLGRLVEAVELFEEVRRDDAAPASARAASAQQIEALTPQLGLLVVHIDGPTEGLTVRLDDRVLPQALVGIAAPADPGPHAADVARDGVLVAHGTVEVLTGTTAELALVVPAAPAPTAIEVARHDARSRASSDLTVRTGSDGNTWLWVGLAVGAAVVAAVCIVAVVLSQPPSPWNGDTSPGILRW